MSDKLTQKQENFVQNLFIGMSQREAYIKAGYSPNQQPAVLDNHAYELASNGDIVVRLDELRKPGNDSRKMQVAERAERLSQFGREDIVGKWGINRQSSISAIAELNKMDGSYEPVKVDFSAGLEALLKRINGLPELPEGSPDALG